MLLSFVGCTKEEPIDITEYMVKGSLKAGVIDENDTFSLSWDDDEKCVVLTNKLTGVSWSTTPSEYLATPSEEKVHRARNFLESPIYGRKCCCYSSCIYTQYL